MNRACEDDRWQLRGFGPSASDRLATLLTLPGRWSDAHVMPQTEAGGLSETAGLCLRPGIL